MRLVREYGAFLMAAAFLVVAVAGVFPYFQYYIDPDATAYLSLAKRYVSGDWQRAVNGYWSPWAVWLTAILIKLGAAPFAGGMAVNAAGGVGFLAMSDALFRKFRLGERLRMLLCATISVFLVYAVFWQSFDDLWECFFLLAALRPMLSERYAERPALWVLTGIAGALSYFSKAYAFPFFILEMLCCGYVLSGGKRRVWLRISGASIGTMVLLSMPWIWLLHEKYGRWMTGTAGSLNMSWYLVGHPYWKEGIRYLLPPVYPDSVSYWEDPWMVNGVMPQFWSSLKLFLLQGVKTGFNLLKFVQSANELSSFFLPACLLAVAGLRLRNSAADIDKRKQVLLLSFLLFPAGYVLINFQGRYLWYMLPLSMVICLTWVRESAYYNALRPVVRAVLLAIFCFSFIVYPVLGLRDMYRCGEPEYRMAEALKKQHINGSFTMDIPYSKETQRILRVAYFSDNTYYYLPLAAPAGGLLQEMRRYHIRYFFHFNTGADDGFILKDESGRPVPEAVPGRIPGMKVFDLWAGAPDK